MGGWRAVGWWVWLGACSVPDPAQRLASDAEEGPSGAPSALRPRWAPGGLELGGVDSAGRPHLRVRLAEVDGRGQGGAEPWRSVDALGGPRFEASRPGATEWWQPREGGFEHGFDVEVLPASGRLSLGVAFEGADVQVVGDQRAAVWLPRGRQYTYEGLSAWDATGRALPAHFAPSALGLAIVVDVVGAVAPVTVDPLLASPSWKNELNIASAQYGRTVASAGDVNGDGFEDLLVSAPYQSNSGTSGGRVYLHLGTPDGPNPTPVWSVSAGQASAEAGIGLAPLRDVNQDGYADFAVGIPKWDGPETDEGAVWVFHGGASGPSTTPARVLESNLAGAQFGTTLSSAGDVNGDGFPDLIVGAPSAANGQSNEGRAYVFLGGSGGIAATPVWTVEANLSSAKLGSAVVGLGDLDGDGFDEVAVGAPGVSNGHTTEGRVMVFRGQASGVLVLAQSIEPNATSVGLGRSLAAGDLNLDGRLDLAVGGSQLPGGSNASVGAVFVYATATGASFATTPYWQRSGNTHLAAYGTTLAIADVTGDGVDDLLSGGPSEFYASSKAGAVYLHLGRLEGLDPHAQWSFNGAVTNAAVGTSVAAADVDGDGVRDVLVGAPSADSPESNEGQAFVFFGVGKDPYNAPASFVDPWGNSGGAVGTAGDLNGDGFAEVLIATAGSGLMSSDRAGMLWGTPAGIKTPVAWSWTDGLSYSRFGSEVAGEVDVNGDGLIDVVIGGARASGGSGSAYVFLGDGVGLPATPSWTITGNNRYFGYSLAVDDFNNDGFDDLLVGDARGGSATEGGQVWLYLSGEVAPTSFVWYQAGSSYAGYGYDLAAAGDLQGDGYPDVFVSSNGGLNGSSSRIQLYRGTAAGLATSAAWTWNNPVTRSKSGALAVGDFNGDGRTDLANGAPGSSLNGFAEGRVHAFYGTTSASGMPSGPSWTAFMPPARVGFGGAIAALDFNGDGYDDLAVGFTGQSTFDQADGAVYIYYGGPGGLASTWAWRTFGRTWRHNLGAGLARAGDVNGDGIDDLLVSASGEGNYLYFGFTDADRDGVSAFVDCDDNAPLQGMVGPRFRDVDGDGFGAERVTATCERDPELVELGGDCDDNNPAAYPWAPEPCDGVDNDCDGAVDEDSTTQWYVDADSDTYGAGTPVISCTPVTGRVSRAGDCDDTTNTVRPGATELCNGVDDDCDGTIDEGAGAPKSWYRDLDGDGYGAGAATVACAAPDGHVASNTDCNDDNAAVRPGATEICNGLDDDCDLLVDEGAAAPKSWYADTDGDTFGAGAATVACVAPTGQVASNTDCDDNNAAVKPTATEVCNGIDDDCDLAVDEGAAAPKSWVPDADGDAFPRSGPVVLLCAAPVGHIAPRVDNRVDCDDADASIFPGAVERCDDRDNDCDGEVDDSVVTYDWYPDVDADLHGDRDAAPVNACDAPFTGAVPDGTDCDDAARLVNPAATELCNGVDDDCDGVVDRDAASWQAFYADGDADGFPNVEGPIEACEAPTGRIGARDDDAVDCDDAKADVHPAATEACNGIDDDCDGVTDEGDAAPTPWHPDVDEDGFAAVDGVVITCEAPQGFVAPPLDGEADCDDERPDVSPAAEEVCNGVDDDCDGEIDQDLPRFEGWIDLDGDGVGAGERIDTCAPPADFVLVGGDCDDETVSVSPSAEERCNGVDDDCDGEVDEDVVLLEQWPDVDADGWGTGASIEACDLQPGHAAAMGDCDDTNADVFPGAAERCNGVDDDCDGEVDGGLTLAVWWRDADADGWGAGAAVEACEQPPGHVDREGDCDDTRADAWPGAPERCNEADDDCDGVVDNGAPMPEWFRDIDGDGYGAGASVLACEAPSERVARDGDCDVTDPAVHPGAVETCNGVDDDCNGFIDDHPDCGGDTGVPVVRTLGGGAGCACEAGGGGGGAAGVLLLGVLAVRRRR